MLCIRSCFSSCICSSFFGGLSRCFLFLCFCIGSDFGFQVCLFIEFGLSFFSVFLSLFLLCECFSIELFLTLALALLGFCGLCQGLIQGVQGSIVASNLSFLSIKLQFNSLGLCGVCCQVFKLFLISIFGKIKGLVLDCSNPCLETVK